MRPSLPQNQLQVINKLINAFGVSQPLAEKMYAVGQLKSMALNQVITHQNSPPNGCLFVLEGFAINFLTNESGVDRAVGIAAAGNAMYEDLPYHTLFPRGRLEASEPGYALLIDFADMSKLKRESEEFSELIFSIMSEKMQCATKIFYFSHERDIAYKIGITLAILSGYAKRTSLPISKEQLASVLGMSRNTVTKALQSWIDQDIIRIENKTFIINDKDKLGLDSF
ncbi:Crp/Fnr family transcriptional regulator [Vibrio sp. WXL103]|uniref:Crp/Fnr family transcriptional regulator n=1 Tax=Vibrio sp. WXL103 TaxID=3450710 RepID=UPI003EC566A0